MSSINLPFNILFDVIKGLLHFEADVFLIFLTFLSLRNEIYTLLLILQHTKYHFNKSAFIKIKSFIIFFFEKLLFIL